MVLPSRTPASKVCHVRDDPAERVMNMIHKVPLPAITSTNPDVRCISLVGVCRKTPRAVRYIDWYIDTPSSDILEPNQKTPSQIVQTFKIRTTLDGRTPAPHSLRPNRRLPVCPGNIELLDSTQDVALRTEPKRLRRA